MRHIGDKFLAPRFLPLLRGDIADHDNVSAQSGLIEGPLLHRHYERAAFQIDHARECVGTEKHRCLHAVFLTVAGKKITQRRRYFGQKVSGHGIHGKQALIAAVGNDTDVKRGQHGARFGSFS